MRSEIYINPRSLVTIQEAAEILGVKRRTMDKLRKLSNFPKTVLRPAVRTGHISTRTRKYFIYQDIINYIDNLKDKNYNAEYVQKRIKHKEVWNQKTEIVEERAT